MNPKTSQYLQVTIAEFIENYPSKYSEKLANLIIFYSILEQIYIIQNCNSNVMTKCNAIITPKLNLRVLLSESVNGGGRH